MIIDEIMEYYSTRPFQPFEVRQSDGQTYLIEHPEWMLVTPDRTTLHFVTREGRSRHLALHQITSVAQASLRRARRSKPTKQ